MKDDKIPKQRILRAIGEDVVIDEMTGNVYKLPKPDDIAKLGCPICAARKELVRKLDTIEQNDGAFIRERERTSYYSEVNDRRVYHAGKRDNLNECPNCRKITDKNVCSTTIETKIKDKRTVHSHACSLCGWHELFFGEPCDDDLRGQPFLASHKGPMVPFKDKKYVEVVDE